MFNKDTAPVGAFDPIFTKAFFTLPKAIEEKSEISFPFPPGNNEEEFAHQLKAFLKSDQGKKYREGVGNIIQGILDIIQQWGRNPKTEIWMKNLNNFRASYFFNYEGLDEKINQELYELFTKSVRDLNDILSRLGNPYIPQIAKETAMGNLLRNDELKRCAPAIADFIRDAKEDLATDPSEILAEARRKIARALVEDEYVQLQEQALEEQSLGRPALVEDDLDVHYIRYFLDSYKQELGIVEQKDYNVRFCDKNRVNKLFEICTKKIPSVITLDSVLLEIIKKFDLMRVVKNLKERLNKSTEEPEDLNLKFSRCYQEECKQLKKSLNRYGSDRDEIVAPLFNLETDDDDNIKDVNLQANAIDVVLKLILIQRLFSKGLLDKNQRLEITLNEKDHLFLLLGKNNYDWAYVKGDESLLKFSDYYAKLPDLKKTEIVNILIKKIKDAQNTEEYKAIEYYLFQFSQNDETLYLKLLEENICQKYEEVIFIAAEKGWLDVIKYVERITPEAISRIHSNGFSVLHFAIQGGNLSMVQYLMEKNSFHGIYGASTKYSCLYLAIKLGQLNIVRYLCQQGAILKSWEKDKLLSMANDDETLLDFLKINLISSRDVISVEKSEAGLVYDEKMYILAYLASKGFLKCVKYLVEECKFSINGEPKKGLGRYDSPLCQAVKQDRMEVVQYLLSKGADINIKGIWNTPLEYAVIKKHKQITDFLLLQGAKVHQETCQGVFSWLDKGRDLYSRNEIHALLDKLKTFKKLPESNPVEKFTSRKSYLHDLRQRCLEMHRENNPNYDREMEALNNELKEFHQFEKDIEKLKKLLIQKPSNKNAYIVEEGFLALIGGVDHAYLDFMHKKSAKEATRQLIKKIRNYSIHYANEFSAKSSLKISVFNRTTLKQSLDKILEQMNKLYPVKTTQILVQPRAKPRT